jgi:hypothetical protein
MYKIIHILICNIVCNSEFIDTGEPFPSVGYRARLLFICGLYKRDRGKILSVYNLNAHRVIIDTFPLILNPVIGVGVWLASGPDHCLSGKISDIL